VETFFHEFGHLMHQTLTKARYASMSGTSVARDFVEAPSQVMENFPWEREVLDEISGYYQDPSRKLPEELRQKMLAARDFNQGLTYLTQIAYATIDMMVHTVVPRRVSRLFNQLKEVIGLVPVDPDGHQDSSFGHFMGYGAGYYSYLWSKVFAEEIFARFKNEGLFNPAVGAAYRRSILETGSSRPEMDSLREFLGHEPSVEAFLRRLSRPTPSA
jgi:thimet oligopeptidase